MHHEFDVFEPEEIVDIPNNSYSPGNDYVTQTFLKSQPSINIPLLDRIELLSQPTDKTYLLLMSRAEGQPIFNVWGTLSEDQRNKIREQLVVALKDLRQFTAPGAQTVDGRPLDDRVIATCHPIPKCKRMGFTTEEWFENIAEELRVGISKIHKTKDSKLIERELQKMKDNSLDPEPYVLTHGDLFMGNIMVKGDKVTAIIDWEYAGYYPWWAEFRLNDHRSFEGSHELLDPIWDRISPRYENASYQEVCRKIEPVKDAWNACSITHKQNWDCWYRPAFSKNEPWAGAFRLGRMGGDLQKVEHIIDEDQDAKARWSSQVARGPP